MRTIQLTKGQPLVYTLTIETDDGKIVYAHLPDGATDQEVTSFLRDVANTLASVNKGE